MLEHRGYQILRNVVPSEMTEAIYTEGLRLRTDWTRYSEWMGIPCASRFSYILSKFYRSYMPQFARQFMEDDIYYFNDQMVMKLPHDNLVFEPHYDNYYGPNRNGEIQTINLSVILNDITDECGGFRVRDNGRWKDLTLKRGDILAIDGNTMHMSGENKSSQPRGVYACVFTRKPLGMTDYWSDKVDYKS